MASEATGHEVPTISAITLRLFRRIVRIYFRRHFRSVMIQHPERMAQVRGPLIVYANHSSWWDPMVSLLLAQLLAPDRKHYAPMDASALARYPILRKIGIFPVEMGSARGAAQFIRTSQAILKSGGVVWITPQGRFADPRELSLEFKPGLGALVSRVPEASVLPLAIEYTFWDERLPETLLRFGPPVQIATGAASDEVTRKLKRALMQQMQELKNAAMLRDANAFEVLLTGGRGTGGWYGVGRWIRARFGGRGTSLDHTERLKQADAGEKL